jgi:hypothetical protein
VPYAKREKVVIDVSIHGGERAPLEALVVTEHDGGVDPGRLEAFVRDGGTLVLTDGAVRALSEVAGVPSGAITRQTSDPGTDLPHMDAGSRDFSHPLLAGLKPARGVRRAAV